MPKSPDPAIELQAIRPGRGGFMSSDTILRLIDYAQRSVPRFNGDQFQVNNNHDGVHAAIKRSFLEGAVKDIVSAEGLAGINWIPDPWDSDREYVPKDALEHNGDAYIATEINTNKEPGVAADWADYWDKMSGTNVPDVPSASGYTGGDRLTLEKATGGDWQWVTA